jgi:GNAT superfamily N-acetyltransferase
MAHERFLVELLSRHHDRSEFSCGVDALDRYLRQQAGQEMRRYVASVYVLYDRELQTIAGYYTLSAFSVEPTTLPDDISRRLPRYESIPAVLLGRLATDTRYRGQGFGGLLLINALRRSLEVSTQVGAAMVVVDAIDRAAASFYERYGFHAFPSYPNRLFITMQTIATLYA